jgi:outer membrane protein X
MKNLLFVTVLLLGIFTAHAQDNDRIFNPWKVDLSLGAAIPQGQGSKGGGLFVLEPKYAVVDQFWVGLRIEAAVMARSFAYSDGSSSSTSVSASASYLVTGDFYFTTTNFRPFIGGGAGFFRLASATVDGYSGSSSDIASTAKFGAMLRAGFEIGHFRMGAEYNLIGN